MLGGGRILYNETHAYYGVAYFILLILCFLSKDLCAQLIIYNFQVQGQLSLLSGAVLTFGLTRYPYSEFELMAEELLMSDSTIKVIFFFFWSLVMFIYSPSTCTCLFILNIALT